MFTNDFWLGTQNTQEAMSLIKGQFDSLEEGQGLPKDTDWIFAVHQARNYLEIANHCEHLVANPVPPWNPSPYYLAPNVSDDPYVIVDMRDAKPSIWYIQNRLGSHGDYLAARPALGNQPKWIFAYDIGIFAALGQPWRGTAEPDQSWPLSVPSLASGTVIPGGNYLPVDNLYIQALANILGLTANPELVNHVAYALANRDQVSAVLDDPVEYLNNLANVQNIELPVELVEAFESGIRTNMANLNMLRARR